MKHTPLPERYEETWEGSVWKDAPPELSCSQLIRYWRPRCHCGAFKRLGQDCTRQCRHKKGRGLWTQV